MDTPHSKTAGAVVTRLHDIGRNTCGTRVESGAAAFHRGAARGRSHHRATYGTAADTVIAELVRGAAEQATTPVVQQQAGPGAAEGMAPAPATQHTEDTEAAFTAYVRERRASLYAAAYHLTGDRYEAEDLLQSALFSTYRAWHRISDKGAVGGYLRRTMTNLHISAWRRRKLNEYPTEELPEAAGDTDAMRGTELRTVLWQALARLPEQQRTMLVLRYYEGRTDPEIAETLGISVGTVKSSIWRTLRRLREDQVLASGHDQGRCFEELVA
ncbi:SigE family RNA polymerase sigma factor [Streptomyces sp. NPDC059740]|uniref:SigE family RNA polymerase sigma factor n=1 Tax=Streptomyces sp. NPDC059740 TaxID=3346926 RepID=UPI0036501E14